MTLIITFQYMKICGEGTATKEWKMESKVDKVRYGEKDKKIYHSEWRKTKSRNERES